MNIQIKGNITNINNLSYIDKDYLNAISYTVKNTVFDIGNDFIEFYIYDLNNTIQYVDYNYKLYKVLPNITTGLLPSIEIDPISDLQSIGLSYGNYITRYNFFKKTFFNSNNLGLYINNISDDRTEIEISSFDMPIEDLKNNIQSLINQQTESEFFIPFLLNFNNNIQYLITNIAVDNDKVLLKLYTPLSEDIKQIYSKCYINELVTDPYIFELELNSNEPQYIPLSVGGPNFNININNVNSQGTNFINYNNFINSPTSSYNNILNILSKKSIDLNIEYNDFSNFIHFSSAKNRIINFYSKVKNIEDNQNVINRYLPYVNSTSSLQQSINIASSSISDTIKYFDSYEYDLYYNSSSYGYPKSGSLPYSTSSIIVQNWYNSYTSSAETYDNSNLDRLIYSLPEYIQNDSNNQEFLKFVDMVGHHYDYLYNYIQCITDKNSSFNNLDTGINKNLIYNSLQSFGIKLDSTNSDLYNYLLNNNTSSIGNNIDYEIYKRLYHNLPYLTKTKGTLNGLRALISCFGIPDTILNIKEYGGIDKYTSSYETQYNRFSYGSNCLVPYSKLSNDEFPKSTEFLFYVKNKFTSSNNGNILRNRSVNNDTLNYSYTASSNNIRILFNNTNIFSCSLDYFTNKTWGVLVNNNSTSIDVFIGNKDKMYSLYNYASSWDVINDENFLELPSPFFQYRELKYWANEKLNTSSFKNHILNPTSYEGNSITSSYDNLYLRIPLGNDLKLINTQSVHPNQSIIPYLNHSLTSSIIILRTGSVIDYVYENASDSYKPNNDKIRIINNRISGSVLSPWINLGINDKDISRDLHYIDVSISPVNSINKDISNQIGDFSLDNYVGDYNNIYSSSYNSITNLNKFYFSKYNKYQFKYNQYLNIFKIFNNSLFKLINNFIPLKSNPFLGLTITSNQLERNKVKNYRPDLTNNTYSSSINNICIPNTNTNINYYNNISGDKSTFFNGQIDGYYTNLNNYFTSSNYNPFIKSYYSESINNIKGTFLDTMYFNITKNILSNNRKKLENNNITSNIEYNDYNDNITSFINSKYIGYNVQGTDYNQYNKSNNDISYGENPPLNIYYPYFAWISNIPSSSLNFADKTIVNIKYLIDIDENITDLSYHNNNINVVQNIFKSDNKCILSIQNPKKLSDQTNINGYKFICKGGYIYDPILYRENNETLVFEYDYYISSSIQGLGIKGISGDTHYYKADRWANNGGRIIGNPSLVCSDYWNGYEYRINDIIVNNKRIAYTEYLPPLWKYNSPSLIGTNYSSIPSGWAGIPRTGNTYGFDVIKFLNTSSNGGYNYEPDPQTYNESIYKVPRTSNYIISGSIFMEFNANDEYDGGRNNDLGGGWQVFKIVGILEKTTTPQDEASWQYVGNSRLYLVNNGNFGGRMAYDSSRNAVWYDNNLWAYPNPKFEARLEGTFNLNVGEYIRYQFYWIDITAGFTNARFLLFSLNYNKKSFLEISDANNNITTYFKTKEYTQVPYLFTGSTTYNTLDTLTFSSESFGLFDSSSFVPNKLYSKYYTNVVDNFSIKKYDLIRIGQYESPTSQYFEVKEVNLNGYNYNIVLNDSIPVSIYNNAQNFAIFRPKQDETSIILNYKKREGEVDQSILLPYNIEPKLKNQIGNIIKNINIDLK